MNVSRMSNKGAVDTLIEICDGLCAFVKENREANGTILNMLKNELLDDIKEAVGVIADHDTVEDFCEEIKNIMLAKKLNNLIGHDMLLSAGATPV